MQMFMFLVQLMVFMVGLVLLFKSSFMLVCAFIGFLVLGPKVFYSYSMMDVFKKSCKDMFFKTLPNKYLKGFMANSFMLLLFCNIIGNIPFMVVPSIFYSYSLSFSFMVWASMMISAHYSNMGGMLSHLLPYGAPLGLMVLLPLIEALSSILRPLTLSVRISTNLAAGHILLFIFSYFTTLMGSVSSVLVVGMLIMLTLLEILVSVLQAYIMITLLSLYVLECEDILL